VGLFPIRFELRNPRPGEPPLQIPSLLRGLVEDRDSQHCFLRSWNEIANGVPFSESGLKFLKVNGDSGDRTKKKICSQEACQRATARLVAACRFHGIEKNCESRCGN
jgi:hypothetical protein